MKKEKIRYCKYCGSLIESESKICSGCGKEYFNIKKFGKAHILVFFALVIVSVSSSFFAIANGARCKNLQAKADFIDSHLAFVTNTGEKYHKYDCFHIEGREYEYMSRLEAINNGYHACSDCY